MDLPFRAKKFNLWVRDLSFQKNLNNEVTTMSLEEKKLYMY
jgi:hypothetical protein